MTSTQTTVREYEGDMLVESVDHVARDVVALTLDAQALRAWLFTILYRLYLDGKRRERLHARWLSWFGRAERDDEPVGDNLEAIILAQADLQAFSRLSAEQRALLLLVSVEGLSYKEAAQALGIPIGTVMSRLSRARNALRELTEGSPQPPALRRLK